MADNVPLATGPLVVATKQSSDDAQHQKVVGEFLSGGQSPIPVGIQAPLPTADDIQIALLTSILVEIRCQNEIIYTLAQTEVEPLEALRAKYRDYPVTP